MKNPLCVLIGVSIVALLSLASGRAEGALNSQEDFAADHFAVELGNKKTAGFVKSVEGGGVKAEPVNYAPAAPNFIKADLA
ncbi:MAG: hypothetical protein ACREH5_01795, partial [Candidatus Omnitrophota bacterium]